MFVSRRMQVMSFHRIVNVNIDYELFSSPFSPYNDIFVLKKIQTKETTKLNEYFITDYN